MRDMKLALNIRRENYKRGNDDTSGRGDGVAMNWFRTDDPRGEAIVFHKGGWRLVDENNKNNKRQRGK